MDSLKKKIKGITFPSNCMEKTKDKKGREGGVGGHATSNCEWSDIFPKAEPESRGDRKTCEGCFNRPGVGQNVPNPYPLI